MVEDQILQIETDTYITFQLYFYENFFGPKHESAILNHENLHKKLVYALSNEFFALVNGNNEEIIQQYIVKVSKFD